MADITPLPAATVTLVRDGPEGLEVLMMKRNLQSAFVPGKYVFPGGAVDPADAANEVYARCMGLDDAAASKRLGVAAHGLAYWIAAIRESFEEAGLLLARAEGGRPIAHAHAAELAQHRKAVAAGELRFEALLRDEELTLAVDELVYFAHWITPQGAPRRYDTRFFIARAPAGQEPAHDNEETIESVWMSPREGVERHRAGTFKLMTPTIHTLREFARHDTADALIAAMRALPDVPTIAPRIGKDGRRIMPGEPGYDEAAARESQGKWTS
jgi:8-oxo-dGTP pyrophosphatase MutT (NUDIX family)